MFCVSEKERDEAEDVVFAMVLYVSDLERDEEAEEVWEREKKLKRVEKEREDDEEVWERQRRSWRGLRKREKFERWWYCVWETESEMKVAWEWILFDFF